MHPEGPTQSISTTVSTEDCLHLKEKSVLMLMFFFVLSKTQIRVIECNALKLLKTKKYVIKTNVTSPYEKPEEGC